MADLEVFRFGDRQVRTLVRDGEPWFVANDAAAVLGLGNPRSSVALLDDDERAVHSMDTPSGRQDQTVVSESGLYSLILRSRRPEAKMFKRWITHEVLPSIRKTGQYRQQQWEIPQTYAEALELAAKQTRALEETQAALAIASPKAEAHDAFESADGFYGMDEVAKMIQAETGLGRNLMFARLRELGVLQKNNVPYQRYAHHFHVIAQFWEGGDGRRKSSFTTKVRPTGVDFIRRKLGSTQGVLIPMSDPSLEIKK